MKNIKKEKNEKHFQVNYVKNGKNMEVLVDFDSYNEFKKDITLSVFDVLEVEEVFINQKKGEIFPKNELKEIFDEKTEEEIYREIILKGDCQIPTEFLNKLREEKKEQIANYISTNSINPQTKMKYSLDMIKSEISKIKYSINPNQNYIHQAEEILKKLKEKIPISLRVVILDIKIPVKYVGNFNKKIRSFGSIKKEFYENDGSLKIHIEVMEGRLDEVINFIKNNSKNEAEYHTLN